VAAAASAADLPREGNFDFTTCWTRHVTRIEYASGRAAWSYDERGTAVSEPRGGMFDGDQIHCVGATVNVDGKFHGNSACIATAPDGATRLSRVWYGEDGKLQRETIGGTGKYGGMATTGTIKTVKEPPEPVAGTRTVEYCSRNTGTYKVK
jgi:hypothetical protein